MTRLSVNRRRLGFTLVELLVVIAIIGLLVALLIPAIAGAVRAARSASVQAEINQMAQALAAFKSKFGDYPPSRIALTEHGFYSLSTGGGGVATSATYGAASSDVQLGILYQRTVTAFRKFWPRVVLNSSAATPPWYDFNGDTIIPSAGQPGSPTNPYILEGQQCLVFFLGGIPIPDGAGGVLGMSGFSKDPTNPFANPIAAPNRSPSYFEFAPSRLILDAQGMPGYTDSLNPPSSGTPGIYAYFSTNNGMGYDPNDVNNPIDSDSSGNSPLYLSFNSSLPLYDSTGTSAARTASPSPNPYTTSYTVPVPPAVTVSVIYQNAQSFQIFSPGVDGDYGVGGIYAANATGANGALPPQGVASSTADRTIERDNLTNFHNGKLD